MFSIGDSASLSDRLISKQFISGLRSIRKRLSDPAMNSQTALSIKGGLTSPEPSDSFGLEWTVDLKFVFARKTAVCKGTPLIPATSSFSHARSG